MKLLLFKPTLPETATVFVFDGALESPLVFTAPEDGLYQLSIVALNSSAQPGLSAVLYVNSFDSRVLFSTQQVLGVGFENLNPQPASIILDLKANHSAQVGLSSSGPTRFAIRAALTQLSRG